MAIQQERGVATAIYEGATFLYKTGDATAVQDAPNRGKSNITRCTIVHTSVGEGRWRHGITRGADT